MRIERHFILTGAELERVQGHGPLAFAEKHRHESAARRRLRIMSVDELVFACCAIAGLVVMVLACLGVLP